MTDPTDPEATLTDEDIRTVWLRTDAGPQGEREPDAEDADDEDQKDADDDATDDMDTGDSDSDTTDPKTAG